MANSAEMTATGHRPKISIVVPVYNEELVVDAFFVAIDRMISATPGYDWEFVCVDDGSKDRSLEKLVAIAARDPRVVPVELSRNFGKEAAMTAGLAEASGDAVVVIDIDLQDPPELISEMITAWKGGADTVVAKRVARETDGWAKRVSAEMFYEFFNKVSPLKLPENVGDFRLMSRQVVDAVLQLQESQRFMKGIFAWVGFRTVTVEYVRPSRFDGVSKFSFLKLWNLAVQGITSFSDLPLRVWTYFGFAGAAFSGSYMLYMIVRFMLSGSPVPGYPSLLVSVLFFGSLQLFGIGLLGEYLGRTYIESKRRPTFLVRKVYRSGDANGSGGTDGGREAE